MLLLTTNMKAYGESNDTITLKRQDLGVTRFVCYAYIWCYNNIDVTLGLCVGG